MDKSGNPEKAIAYLDESGDLGWNFNAPYRRGGSSRHLTICAIVTPHNKRHLPGRLVKRLYNKFKCPTNKEMKWGTMNKSQKDFFAQECCKFLQQHKDIKCLCITVYKPNVKQHIREDSNKLYNYMVGLLLIDELANYENVIFTPDPRSIKVASGNSLCDYLKIKLWFDKNAKTKLINMPIDSSECKGLQFADMVAGIAQQKYEDGGDGRLLIIRQYITFKKLFFSKENLIS